MTGGKRLPKEIVDQIVERTDGVPLFIEELTKTIIESGIVTEGGESYSVAAHGTPLAIPTTLQGSLLARLDRLAPTREVAQIAAALGRQFSHELISAVTPIRQQQLDNALAQLVSAELLFQRGEVPDAEYTFKHALVQEAAYGTLLRSQRHLIDGRSSAHWRRGSPRSSRASPRSWRTIAGKPANSKRPSTTFSQPAGGPWRARRWKRRRRTRRTASSFPAAYRKVRLASTRSWDCRFAWDKPSRRTRGLVARHRLGLSQAICNPAPGTGEPHLPVGGRKARCRSSPATPPLPSPSAPRPSAGCEKVVDGLFELAGFPAMVRQLLGLAVDDLGEPLLQCADNSAIDQMSLAAQQRAVSGFLHERVLKCVFRVGHLTALERRLGADELRQGIVQLRLPYGRNRADQLMRKLTPERRRNLCDLARRREAIEAGERRGLAASSGWPAG